MCCAVIRGCGTCQFLTLTTVLGTVRSKYHPLEDCSRLQTYADDSSLGFGVLVDGDFDRLQPYVLPLDRWMANSAEPVADELWDV